MNRKIFFGFPLTMTSPRFAIRALCTVVVGLVLGLDTGRAQAVKELSVMILRSDGKRQRGFIQNSNENGLLFSLVEGSPGSGLLWEKQVTAVAFDNADEIMREARAAYNQRDYESAAEQLGKVADDYVIAAWVPDSFAAEARFYQIDSLRRLGRWKEIAPLLSKPTAKAIPKVLTQFYQSQFVLNQAWGALGAERMDFVRQAVSAREVPQTGAAKMLPSPIFKKMPNRELVQVSFLRAKLYESENKPALALNDYYRSFTLNFSYDPVMTDLAMNAALAIQAKDPVMQREKKDELVVQQIQSLAFLYKNAFGKGEIDPAYAAFAVKPKIVQPVAKEVEDEEEEPDMKEDPDAAKKPDDSKGKGDKEKGDKAKPKKPAKSDDKAKPDKADEGEGKDKKGE